MRKNDYIFSSNSSKKLYEFYKLKYKYIEKWTKKYPHIEMDRDSCDQLLQHYHVEYDYKNTKSQYFKLKIIKVEL